MIDYLSTALRYAFEIIKKKLGLSPNDSRSALLDSDAFTDDSSFTLLDRDLSSESFSSNLCTTIQSQSNSITIESISNTEICLNQSISETSSISGSFIQTSTPLKLTFRLLKKMSIPKYLLNQFFFQPFI